VTENDSALSEEQQEEMLSELKRALGGRIEGITTGISCAMFTIALARTGLIPLVPNSLSQLELFGFAIVFAGISGILYLLRSRPHQKRLQEMMQEWEEMKEES
jgi:hypothetical protein